VAKLKSSTPAGIQLHLRIKIKPNSPNLPAPFIPQHPQDYPDSSTSEVRALEYFRCVTATGLSTWFAEIFWKYQLPQVAHTEPSIRHALIAISATYEALEAQRLASLYDPEIESPSVTRKPFACGHYGTAVGHLSRVLANAQASEELAMMASSLFVILKFMWGYFEEAMVHLHNEVEIFDAWKKRKGITDNSQILEGSLEHNLMTIIQGQSFTSLGIEDPLSKLCVSDPEYKYLEFTDVKSARESLRLLFRESLRLIRLHGILTKTRQAPGKWEEFDSELSCHRRQWEEWNTRLYAFVQTNKTVMTLDEEESIEESRAMYFAAQIWLHVGIISPSQPDTPLAAEPTELFNPFLTQCERLYRRWLGRNKLQQLNDFLLNGGAIPPLHYIRTKSESRATRIRAVRLLSANLASVPDLPPSPPQSDRGHEFKIPQTGKSVIFDGRETVEIEIEPGTQKVDLLLKTIRNQGWDVQTEYVE
jgi:hypothetical protein